MANASGPWACIIRSSLPASDCVSALSLIQFTSAYTIYRPAFAHIDHRAGGSVQSFLRPDSPSFTESGSPHGRPRKFSGGLLNLITYPVAIREIHVAGYRSVRNLHLRLGQINILTGANAAGKSNLYNSVFLLARAAAGGFAQVIASEGGMPSGLWA